MSNFTFSTIKNRVR